MLIEVMEKWQVRLMCDGERICGFTCGDVDLDDYILNDSGFFQSELLAANYVLENDRKDVLAFFSLLNDRICISDFDSHTDFNRFRKRRFVQAKRFKGYPAIKIGRLAVADAWRNRGLGSVLLDFIKSYFVKNRRTGCRFLTVDSYHQSIDFYAKNGFIKLKDDDSGNTCLMFFDLIDFRNKF